MYVDWWRDCESVEDAGGRSIFRGQNFSRINTVDVVIMFESKGKERNLYNSIRKEEKVDLRVGKRLRARLKRISTKRRKAARSR